MFLLRTVYGAGGWPGQRELTDGYWGHLNFDFQPCAAATATLLRMFMFDADDEVFNVMFSPASVRRRRQRLRRLRRSYEERVTDAEATLIELRTTLALIDRTLSDYDAET